MKNMFNFKFNLFMKFGKLMKRRRNKAIQPYFKRPKWPIRDRFY